MPPTSKLNPESFLGLVHQSGLVDKNTLKAFVKEQKAVGADLSSVKSVADSLVSRNLLTRWQADKLVQGKHKGFFLGKYRLLSHLGSGGMSSVFLAEHVLMRRRVALKVLPRARVDDSSYLQRFHREAQAVAALDHRNIVRAYDVDQEGDTHFLVMEYVQGQSLHELTVKSGKLEYVAAAEYTRQAAEGLHHAHRMGMVHRDIKPGNLLLDEKGTVKLLDLGLARFYEEAEEHSLTIEHNETVLGTTDYLSPEQARNSHKVDQRSDIYSLGCTLYFLLAGHPPFPQGTMAQRLLAHQSEEPQPIQNDRPDLPGGLLALLRKMMAKSADERFQTAKEAATALQEWLTAHGGEAWSRMNPVIPGGNPLGSSLSGKVGSSVVRASSAPPPTMAETNGWKAHGAEPPVSPDTRLMRHTEDRERELPAAGRVQPNVPAGTEPELAAFFSHLESDAPETLARASAATFVPAQPPRAKPVDFSLSDDSIAEPPQADEPIDFGLFDADDGVPATQAAEPKPRRVPATNAPMEADAEMPTTVATGPRSGPSPSPSPRPSSGPSSGPSRRVKAAPRWLLVGAPALVLVLAVAALWLALGRGKNDAASNPDKSNSGNTVAPSKAGPTERTAKESPTPPVVPARREWHVGPLEEFKTLASALADAKRQTPKGRKSTLTIKVAAGQSLAERIEIDESFPRGIQIVADAGPAPILAPLGPDPVISITGGKGTRDRLEDLRIEGFRIDAVGKEVAVVLSGWTPGVQLRDLQLNGFQRAGVQIEGARTYGSADKHIVLESLTFSHAGPEAVGILLRESPAGDAAQDNDAGESSPLVPTHLRVVKCRLLAPIAAGIKVVGSAIDLNIFNSVFFGTRTGILFEGPQRDWRDVGIAFNTFYENESAIVFSEMPGPNSHGFGFYNNLFVGSRSIDAVVREKYDDKQFVSLYRVNPGGSGHNWTTRPRADHPQPGELVYLFETRQGQFGAADLQFRSLDPESPELLAPVVGSPQSKAGTMLDSKMFGSQVGADISR